MELVRRSSNYECLRIKRQLDESLQSNCEFIVIQKIEDEIQDELKFSVDLFVWDTQIIIHDQVTTTIS